METLWGAAAALTEHQARPNAEMCAQRRGRQRPSGSRSVVIETEQCPPRFSPETPKQLEKAVKSSRIAEDDVARHRHSGLLKLQTAASQSQSTGCTSCHLPL